MLWSYIYVVFFYYFIYITFVLFIAVVTQPHSSTEYIDIKWVLQLKSQYWREWSAHAPDAKVEDT